MTEHAVRYREEKEKRYEEAAATKGLSKEIWMVKNEEAKEKEVEAWEKEERRKKSLKKLRSYKRRIIMAEEDETPLSTPIVEPSTKAPIIVKKEENEERMAGTTVMAELNQDIEKAGKVSELEPTI